MNHDDLLYRARQYAQTSAMALHLAETLKSPADASNRALGLSPALEIDQKFLSKVHFIVNVVAGVSLTILCALYMYMMLFYVPGGAISGTALLAVLGWASGVILTIYVLEKFEKNAKKRILVATTELALLCPIAGTAACLAAATYVKSGAAGVIEWRDHALAERSQLYGFDVEVMRGMYELTQDEQRRRSETVEAVSQEVKLAEACRVAHGLPVSA